MKKLYYKLVRDNVPDIINREGKSCETTHVRPDHAIEELVGVLKDTAQGVESESKFGNKRSVLKEIADTIIVCRYLARYLCCEDDELDDLIDSRLDEAGGYDDLVRLISVEEPDIQDGDGNE